MASVWTRLPVDQALCTAEQAIITSPTLERWTSLRRFGRRGSKVGLSQAELARRAGTSQSAVAGYETGSRTPSWQMLNRMLEPCGFSAGLRLQPRHFDTDRELDAALAKPPGQRLDERSAIFETISRLGSPVVVVGAAALVAHGVPLPMDAVDLAVGSEPAEVEGALTLLDKIYAHYQPSGCDDPLPAQIVPETITLPGPRRLGTPLGAVVVRPGDYPALRARAVGVPLTLGTVWVAGLSDVEPPAEHAELVRRYLDRLRARAGG